MAGLARLRGLPLLRKLTLLVGAFYVVQLLAGAAIIYVTAINQTHQFINTISQRAKEDIVYNDGHWDTSKYDADPEIPGTYRLYVITKDGFVIDRWRPIPGYLDTSDFKQLLSYQMPQTVHTVTDQDWRLFSLPVKDKESRVVGLVTVGRFNVAADQTPALDEALQNVAQDLVNGVTVSSSGLNVDKINIRSVPYSTAFQIVDQYNKIRLKSDNASSIDRLPNFIDPSYIADDLRVPSLKKVTDSSHSETFLVQTAPLFDKSNAPIGTIIVARTISPSLALVRRFLLISSLLGLLLVLLVWWLLVRWCAAQTNDRPATGKRLRLKSIDSIEFNKLDCTISINDQKIPVTFATNQYYLCHALFAAPRKKWETDELLDRFGVEEAQGGWRKIYDAMTSLNKKLAPVIGERFILTNHKTYYLNPLLVSKIKK